MRLLLVLVIATVVEVVVLVAVGDAIGVLPTLALLLAASVLGMWLVRREGTRAFTAIADAVNARRIPDRELSDGFLIAIAGALILLPGLISDVLGLLVLVPPTRALLRRRLATSARRRMGPAYAGAGYGTVVDGTVVDGTVVDGTVVDSGEPAPGPETPPPAPHIIEGR